MRRAAVQLGQCCIGMHRAGAYSGEQLLLMEKDESQSSSACVLLSGFKHTCGHGMLMKEPGDAILARSQSMAQHSSRGLFKGQALTSLVESFG